MKKLLYILSLVVMLAACTYDPVEGLGQKPVAPQGKALVAINFNVQIEDSTAATRVLAEKPKLRNLMVAVFDESGYLMEYRQATVNTLATENGVQGYTYSVNLTQSDAPRILHFIGNAPAEVKFGNEETVLASISSTHSTADSDDGIYWYRKVIPNISGTNSGTMALAEGDDEPNTPIYQASAQTQAYMNNIPLIRNFARIQVTASVGSGLTLHSFFVVGVPKSGLAAAYNYTTGEFVDYYKYARREVTIQYTDSQYNPETGENEPVLKEQTIEIDDLDGSKTYGEILDEGYNANVSPTAERVTLDEAKNNVVSAGNYAYVFECEKPLAAEDAAYLIVYGTYDGKKCYYKIDLRDKGGYFPILRNFTYTINMTEVNRQGYETIEQAALSTGSGDVSTSIETVNLAYISDGHASLEVDYTEKYVIEKSTLDLNYTYTSIKTATFQEMWYVVNAPSSSAAAIESINDAPYTVGTNVILAQQKGKLTIITTAPTDAPKIQTLTIFAKYKRSDTNVEYILQRTVKFIVQSKRNMTISLNPTEVPNTINQEFDVEITIPGGLSRSIFPLEFLIESGALSVNPCNDPMPVRTGPSLDGKLKSSMYFVKSFQYSDYDPLTTNVVKCHFKTIKNDAKTHIYAANPYFNSVYNYQSTPSTLDNDGNSIYLNTYEEQYFSNLTFSADPVAIGDAVPVDFTFTMSEETSVRVALGGLEPLEGSTQLSYVGVEDGRAVYEYVASATRATTTTLNLQTADDDAELYVGLSARYFKSESKTAKRKWSQFTNVKFNKNSLASATEEVEYSFTIPTYSKGLVVNMTLDGLTFASGVNNLPTGWKSTGNNTYAYTPTKANENVNVTLKPADANAANGAEFSVKLEGTGYETITSTINISSTITIPAGNLVMKINSYSNNFNNNGTIYIYMTNGTQIGSYKYTYTSSGNTRTATNSNAVTLSGVLSTTEIYVTFSRNGTNYKSPNFTVGEACDRVVNLNMSSY